MKDTAAGRLSDLPPFGAGPTVDLWLGELGQSLENCLGIGLFALGMHVYVAHVARLVDDEHGALRPAIRTEHAVAQRHFPVRPVITQQRVVKPTQRLGKGVE